MSEHIADIVTAETVIDNSLYVKAAQAAVRSYCGWHVAPIIEETLTVDGSGTHRLLLPSKHVLAVEQVNEIINGQAQPITDYTWSASGILRREDKPFTDRYQAIRLTIKHGWNPEDIPDVQALIIQMARRAANAPAGIVRSQSVNGATVTMDMSGGGAPMINLLASEKSSLARYRLEAHA